MTQAIQKFEQPKYSQPDVNEFAVMKETATMLVKTGFLPQSIKTPEQAIAIILTGRELGIGTMAALNTINVIQGKPTVSPQLMLALIERSGQLEDIKITNGEKGVICDMKRKGRSAHREIFGINEAKAMKLDEKDNYKKQPLTMYRWRAVAACARVVFPDVILGLYTPDEMGAEVDTEGEFMAPPTKGQLIAMHTAPETVQGEIVEETVSISGLCKQLKAAGDDVEWNGVVLLEYANQLLDADYTSLEQLSDEQRTELHEDLELRLKELRPVE